MAHVVSDGYLARTAFIEHGGSPSEILAIEEMFGVTME